MSMNDGASGSHGLASPQDTKIRCGSMNLGGAAPNFMTGHHLFSAMSQASGYNGLASPQVDLTNIGGGRPDASDVKALLRGRDVVGITESLDADADAGFEVVDQLIPMFKLEVLSKYQRLWKRFVASTLVVMWTRSQFGGISAFTREWAHFCPKKNKRVKGKSAMVEDAEDDEEVEEV